LLRDLGEHSGPSEVISVAGDGEESPQGREVASVSPREGEHGVGECGEVGDGAEVLGLSGACGVHGVAGAFPGGRPVGTVAVAVGGIADRPTADHGPVRDEHLSVLRVVVPAVGLMGGDVDRRDDALTDDHAESAGEDQNGVLRDVVRDVVGAVGADVPVGDGGASIGTLAGSGRVGLPAVAAGKIDDVGPVRFVDPGHVVTVDS
jgi:hypothetical protein